MKSILSIILTLSFLNVYGQGEVGIGIISIKIGQTPAVRFYESSDLKNELKKVELFVDESIKSINIKNIDEQIKWLQPEAIWLDYGQFKLRCKTVKMDSYEVYISSSKTMWIKKEDFTEFINWEGYLKSMFSITRSNSKTQNIYSRPYAKSKIIEFENDCFQVRQMKNEWIEVYSAPHCESKKKIIGWIRWRNGNKILINYYSTS